MESKELQELGFEGRKVRSVFIDGEPWWVLSDVCHILGLTNPTVVASRLDDDERSKFGLGRQGEAIVINESGLYAVIIRSEKPEAKRFRKWVTYEVLPEIRKHGEYKPRKTEITEQSKQARTSLTDQWKNHGANKRYHFINLTRSQYKAMGYGNGVGVHKEDMSEEELARLMVVDASETLKLIRNPQITGYYELNDSISETCSQVDLFVNNVIAAPKMIKE